MVTKKRLYKFPRYWYHLSKTLKEKEITLTPIDDSTNRSYEEPAGARICVAPTIEQCITALTYNLHQTFYIYRTKNIIKAKEPSENAIFDVEITNEGWIEIPMTFVKIGKLDFDRIVDILLENNKEIIEESASSGNVIYCEEVLRWWKKLKVKRFIERA